MDQSNNVNQTKSNRTHSGFYYGIFLYILFSISNLYSQRLPFTTIGLKEGLPQLTVYYIQQDQQGYIWFLNEASLCRYDGYEFLQYPIHFGVEGDFVSGFQFDASGRIWISTLGEGFGYLDGGKLKWLNDLYTLPSDKIGSFQFNHQGDLFITTSDKGIIQFGSNKKPRILYPSDTTDHARIRKIFVSKQGDLFSTGKDGLLRFNKNKNYSWEVLNPDISTMNSCFENSAGEIWIGGDRKLFVLKGEELIDKTYMLESLDGDATTPWHISQSKDEQTIFISTSKGLLTCKEENLKWLTTDNGLPYNDICATFQDRLGNFWVATYAGGAAILDNNGMDHYESSADGAPLYPVSAADDRHGRIWVGSNYNESLFYFENDAFHHFPDKRLDGDRNLLGTMNRNPYTDELWLVGNYGRLIKIKDDKIIYLKDHFNAELPFVEHLHFHTDSTAFFSTRKGIFTMKPGTDQVNPIKEIPEITFRHSFSDDFNTVWMLGRGGEIYTWCKGKITNVSDQINPKKYLVDDGMYDSKHRLWWFCTRGGLIIWNGLESITLNTYNKFPTDYPWSITMDKLNHIWIGHKKGIISINVEDKKITDYGFNRGFTPVETTRGTALSDAEGNIWFGTISSATRVRINDLNTDSRKGILRVQKISGSRETFFEEQIGDTLIPSLNLEYDENTFTVQLAGLFYSNTKEVKYSWYLENFDNTWLPATNTRQALFVDVPAGKYKFHAKSIGPGGFVTNEVIIPITIHAPFWKRPWFYLIEFSILACFVFFSFRFSSDPNKSKLGNFMTLLTILIIFESLLIWTGTYVNKFTNDIPVFQLVMNVIFAATLHPLENLIRKFMRRWAIKKARSKIINATTDLSSEDQK